MSQHRPRYGEGVDGIRLAPFACRSPGSGHHCGRHPDDALACVHQIAFQPCGHGAGVFDTPNELAAEAALSPPQSSQMALGGGRDGRVAELAAGRVDRDQRVRAFVRVDAHDHGSPGGRGAACGPGAGKIICGHRVTLRIAAGSGVPQHRGWRIDPSGPRISAFESETIAFAAPARAAALVWQFGHESLGANPILGSAAAADNKVVFGLPG